MCPPITARRSGRRSTTPGSSTASLPYGTETMHVLRAEKGYIIVGQDTDGTVTPDDAGLSLGHRQEQARLRRQARTAAPGHDIARTASSSSGCATRDPQCVLEEGAQIVPTRQRAAPEAAIGHVTSSYLQRQSRPIHRARAAERAGAPAWAKRCTWPCPTATFRCRSSRRSSMTRRGAASMADLSAARQLQLVAPSPLLRQLPPASRLVLRGGPQVVGCCSGRPRPAAQRDALPCRAQRRPVRHSGWGPTSGY